MGMTWGRMERSAWPDGQKAERAVQPLQRPVHHLEQPQNSAWADNRMARGTIEREAADSGPEKNTYSRPTGWPAGMRDQVWENAKDAHGRVRDPLTGRYMSKDQPWDMGHKPGYEFAKHQKSAEVSGIDREQFRNEYYNPDHYRPELPSSNRSHKGEDKTAAYFGD